MRPTAVLPIVLAICLLGGQRPLEAQPPPRGMLPGIPAEALSHARTRGSVRVIVRLNVAFSREAILGAASVVSQRRSIAAVQGSLLRRLARANAAGIRRFAYIPYLALEVDEADLQALASLPEVVRIDIDTLAAPTLTQSTALIGAPAAWSAGYTGAGWTIAVLDTGVDKTHPMLSGKVVSEACYSSSVLGATSICPGGAQSSTVADSGGPCALASCEHGTHVAGIAAGKSGGLSGVAREASIIAIQIFSSVTTDCGGNPSPCARSFESDLIAGLERVYALRTTYNIAAVNLSLGGGLFTSPCDSLPAAAIIAQLRDAGIATVASSGNDGSTVALSHPACISAVISVGATTDGSSGRSTDEVSSFTNSNQYLTLLAPGETITSSVPGGGLASLNGTSMAAPHVSGAWAVLKSRRPAASVADITNALTFTGVGIVDPGNGLSKPRIQLDAAVEMLRPPCAYALAPLSVRMPRRGGTATVSVTAPAGCAWSASTDAAFVSIVSGSSGHGTATLTLSVEANPFLTRRNAIVMVAGRAVTIDQAGAATGDVDGDGFGDLLWHHLTNGSVATWFLQGSEVIATSRLSIDRVADVDWRIAGGGDLNGDGWADVVWQHDVSGRLAVWYLSGAQVIATAYPSIDRVEETDWKIRAVGDTNGDGSADLIWQHGTDGWLAVWFMRGAEVIGTQYLSTPRVDDISWRIAGAGDIDGDRKADIIWQNDSDGRVAAWLLDGSRVVAQRLLSISSVANPEWKLTGISDANGDGYGDALWQNTTTGELAVWYLTGFEVVGTGRLSMGVGAGSSWHLAGPG